MTLLDFLSDLDRRRAEALPALVEIARAAEEMNVTNGVTWRLRKALRGLAAKAEKVQP